MAKPRSVLNTPPSWMEAMNRCRGELHQAYKLLEKADQDSNDDDVREALPQAAIAMRAAMEPLVSFLGKDSYRAKRLRELLGARVAHWDYITNIREQDYHDGSAIVRQHANIIVEDPGMQLRPGLSYEDNGDSHATLVEQMPDRTVRRTVGPRIERTNRMHLREGEGYGAGLSAVDFKTSLKDWNDLARLIFTEDQLDSLTP